MQTCHPTQSTNIQHREISYRAKQTPATNHHSTCSRCQACSRIDRKPLARSPATRSRRPWNGRKHHITMHTSKTTITGMTRGDADSARYSPRHGGGGYAVCFVALTRRATVRRATRERDLSKGWPIPKSASTPRRLAKQRNSATAEQRNNGSRVDGRRRSDTGSWCVVSKWLTGNGERDGT